MYDGFDEQLSNSWKEVTLYGTTAISDQKEPVAKDLLYEFSWQGKQEDGTINQRCRNYMHFPLDGDNCHKVTFDSAVTILCIQHRETLTHINVHKLISAFANQCLKLYLFW